jgi:hypothetical protein
MPSSRARPPGSLPFRHVPDDQLAAVVPFDDDILDRIDALTRLARAWLGVRRCAIRA